MRYSLVRSRSSVYLRDPRVAVVGRIAEDDENRAVLLDLFGVFAFAFELLEDFGLRGFFRDPSGEGVGEKDSGAMVVGERRACIFQQRCNLKVRDDKRGGHDLEPKTRESAMARRLFGTSAVSSPAFSSRV